MKTAVVYYSYNGHTRDIAKNVAAEEKAEIYEIAEKKRAGKFKAYTAGIVVSIRGKAWPIEPINADLSAFDRLILLAPVWAGNPPPAFNAFLRQLPEGKNISVKMVSMSGKSDCENRLKSVIAAKNCTLDDFSDIKA